jgi:F-type H+-transporting ATPase subunit delta
MSNYRVASRYAKSIFDLAIETKLVDKVYKDMLLIDQVCKENRPLVVMLKNPIIRYDFKLKVLTRLFQKHIEEITLKFISLLCRKNRVDILPDTSKVYVEIYHEYKGIIIANVSSAVKLSSEIQNDFVNIVSKATGKTVELKTMVDEALIGGYILQVGDKMIDNSLKNKINHLRRELKSRQ